MSSPPETPDSFTLQPRSKSLFSESPLLSFSRKTGPGGEDLSLSELSITSDATPQRFPSSSRQEPPRFSLFGPSQSPRGISTYDDDGDEEDGQADADLSYVAQSENGAYEEGSQSQPTTPRAKDQRYRDDDSIVDESQADPTGDVEQSPTVHLRDRRALDPQQREEELRSTLYQMQSINSVLLEYMETLQAVEVNNQDERYAEEEAERKIRERERQEQEARERKERLEQERIEREAEEERKLEERERRARAAEPRGRGAARARGRGVPARGLPPPTARGRGAGTTGLRQPTVLRAGNRARGRLRQTNLVQIDETHVTFTIPNAGSVGHIVVFLIGSTPFPPGYAATIYFEWPNRPFQLLGMLSNDKPSAVFRIRGIDPNGEQQGANSDVNAILGISVEPIDSVLAQVASMHQPGSYVNANAMSRIADPTFLAERIVRHLFIHLSSFESNLGPQTMIPMGVIQRWYDNLVSKLRAGGAGFLTRED
ncbi:hypothetical protein FRB96_005067 [Tulasnella sp. 330]|nr:hypothetical protein FRB96_005067 [Tulasnella sp. 330]KAG8890374.1 hypothetical protein FRB98_008949 [Tulasnella sp. 332]